MAAVPQYPDNWIWSDDERVVGVVKRLWGFTKVRYRALARNASRAFTARALANLFLGRGPLMAQRP